MKYLVRAFKYFLMMTIILILILGALTYYQNHNFNILASLENGWNSLIWIGVILLGFSAAYPAFGYATRTLDIHGDTAEIRQLICSYMEEKRYRVEYDTDEVLTFRHRSPVTRFFHVYEDRITFTPTHTSFTIEGLNRDIVRLKSAIEYKYKNRDIL